MYMLQLAKNSLSCLSPRIFITRVSLNLEVAMPLMCHSLREHVYHMPTIVELQANVFLTTHA